MADSIEGQIVKRKVGRPTKVTPELIRSAYDYLSGTVGISVGQLLPTVEGLALAIGVSRETLYAWEKDGNNEFSDIVANMRSAQAEKLIQNALIGRYNPTIAKLLLSKHGYVEKTEQDTNVTVVSPIVGGMAKAELDEGDEDTQIAE